MADVAKAWLVLAAWCVLCACAAMAAELSLFYPYGPDHGDRTLAQGDDIMSPEIRLQEDFYLFNSSYTTAFVNTNGFVTFTEESPSFTLMGIRRAVAAFHADVDTLVAGRIFYRYTAESQAVQRAAADIQSYFSSFQSFMPTGLLVVTWERVGAYGQGPEKTNTFQLVLASDGENTFAIFHYLDQGMQWRGQGGGKPQDPRSLKAVPPSAGFVGNSPAQNFRLPNWENGNFATESNVNVPGVWMYHIGNTQDGSISAADFNTEEVTVFKPKAPVARCAQSVGQCDAHATCLDHDLGFCCICQEPYYGNGYGCVRKGNPQTLNSRVTGTLNGIRLPNDVNMHTYVVATDGRTYSAIAVIPDQLGPALLTLNSIGGVISWLFAVPLNDEVQNGFSLTGGKFNRTATVTFENATGPERVARIVQTFHGLEDPDTIRLETRLEGEIPDIPLGSDVTIDDYMEDYTLINPGLITSRVRRTYRVGREAFKYTWEQTIEYRTCEAGELVSAPRTVRLSVGKHYVKHTQRDGVVRFAMSSKAGVAGDVDPCTSLGKQCHAKAQCVSSGETFQCVCNDGYYGDGLACRDVDECRRNACDQNARCQNMPGSFRCQCNPGYSGDGRTCTADVQLCGGKVCDINARCVFSPAENEHMCECVTGYEGDGQTCDDADPGCSVCDRNAECLTDPRTGREACRCRAGYTGDGTRCSLIDTGDCRTRNLCGVNAQCVYDPDLREYACECLDEFSGDGYSCQAVDPGCSVCDRNAECLTDPRTGREVCRCRAGYTGDGTRCSLIDTCSTCDADARCVLDPRTNQYRCVCVRGYRGDGTSCELVDCRNQTGMCAAEGGLCWLNRRTNVAICRCNRGYRGDGYRCERVGCDVYNDCDDNAQCVAVGDKYECQCQPGFVGTGRRCRPEGPATCNVYNDCDANARCIPDRSSPPVYSCTCQPGYQGDGKTCRRETPPQEGTCDEYNFCDVNAQCVPDQSETPVYSCRCNEGYSGDGRVCLRESTEEETCDRYNICDRNARCVPDGSQPPQYQCQCNPGFRGDGRRCQQETPVSCNQVNNCDREAQCIYNPDRQSYQCVCNRGFDGDGIRCQRREVIDCRRDTRMCSPHADCTKGVDEAYVCVCRSGYRGDGASCSPVVTTEGSFLVYAQGSKIMKVSTNPSPGDMGQQIAYLDGQLTVGIAVDCVERQLYWTDVAKGAIHRSDMNGSNVETIIKGLKSPEGVAIDFSGRNLFFTDSDLDVVRVASLDGTAVRTLVDKDMVNPRAVALDVNRGTVYWADWNRNQPQIEKINMDGSAREVLVADGLRLPNGLAFDTYSQMLCWGDAGEKRIECVRSDGTGRRVVHEGASYPFDVTMVNNVIYWSDWKREDIPNIDVNGGEPNKALTLAVGGHGRLYGITAVREYCPRARNSCGMNNGGCSFLCLATPNGGRTCACPDGADPRVCSEQ